jgi:hypothetical protein
MDQLMVPSALAGARRVLIAGAGGGYDVYSGLPLYLALRREGKECFLANLTFTYLGGTDATMLAPGLHQVEISTTGCDDYFPERCLARFLAQRGEDRPAVFALEKTGVVPFRAAYQKLVEHLDVDAIVLADGGTDILMRGDEAGLGTPAEDMLSLAAVQALDDVPIRLVTCVGFGIDSFHGVCHAHYLENVAALAKDGAFLGAQALLATMPEVKTYLDSVAHANALSNGRGSIVNDSLASAIEGEFGDYHRNERTRSSTLFINPLMALLWTFDLAALARRSLYLHMLEKTETIWDVQRIIEGFRKSIEHRPKTTIPH